MTPADQFRANIARARQMGTLFVTIRGVTLGAVDLTDILRAQIVLAVSALDHLVHELARVGMLDVYRGRRPETDAYRRFRVPMSAATLGMAAPAVADWFDAAIRESHGWLSFEHPEKIADAVRLFSPVGLWDSVAAQTGIAAADVKTRLKAIVDRRNKIAHEADLDPTLPGATWPIDAVMANEAVDFIALIGDAIVAVS